MQQVPTAYVFSNPNIVSIFLVKELLNKHCRVVVVTELKSEFKKYFPDGIADLIIQGFSDKFYYIPSYIFFIQGFSVKQAFFDKNKTQKVFTFVSSYLPKTQVILPYVVSEKERKNVENVSNLARRLQNRNLNTVYLGEVYGGIYQESTGWVNSVFKNISLGSSVAIPVYDLDIYLVEVRQAINILIREIFSYGFDKREIVVTGKIKAFTFLKKLQEILPTLFFVSDRRITQFGTAAIFDFVEIDTNDEYLKDDIKWFLENKVVEKKETPKVNFNFKIKYTAKLPKLPKHILKYTFILSMFVVWLFAIPFFLLFISSLFLKTGYYFLSANNFNKSDFYFNATEKIVNVSETGFGFFRFDEGTKTSEAIKDLAVIGVKSEDTLNLLEGLGSNISGSIDYDAGDLGNRIFLDLDDLYKQISFLQADIDGVNNLKSFLPDTSNLDTLKKYINNGKIFASNLSEILGAGKKVSYLVLLQDPNNLRPTGGVVTSFGIVSFQDGKLVENSFYDTKTADNLLKGFVAPPAPLKKYLGVTNWYLKDSNWDPDFRVAAAKAEWFLGTETGQTVSGVIAVDSNLYNQLKNFNGTSVSWGQIILKNLDLKNILVFLDDSNFSDSLHNLSWDGGMLNQNCLDNCIDLPFGIVEANLGTTSNNSKIRRNANMLIDLSGKTITGNVEIDFDNSSNESYRTYVRLISTTNASFGTVNEKLDGSINQKINADVSYQDARSEAGVLVQVPANGKTTINYTFTIPNSIDYTKNGKVLISFRKQPGVDAMPLNIHLGLPTFLTRGRVNSYNTSLTNDFVKEIDF